MEKKQPIQIYDMSIEKLMGYGSKDNFGSFISNMEKGGFLITYEAAKTTEPKLTAENIKLSAELFRPEPKDRIFKKDEIKGKIETMKILSDMELNSKKGVDIKSIARNMNDAMGKKQIGDISGKRKFVLILFILEAEKTVGSYLNFMEKRKSKDASEPPINFSADEEEVIEFTADKDENDDLVITSDEDRKCDGEKIYECVENEMCDLENKKCVSKNQSLSSSKNKLQIGNKTFFGSKEVLDRLKECSLDKQCGDNKYCDLKESKCVEKGNDNIESQQFFVEIEGKKFYGSHETLKKLENYCYFDKPCGERKRCLFEEKRCINDDDKKESRFKLGGIDFASKFKDNELRPIIESQKRSYNLYKKANLSKNVDKPQEMKEKPKPVVREKVIETPVPEVLASNEIMKPMQSKALSHKTEKEVNQLIGNILSGQTEQVNDVSDVQNKVLKCLGLV